MRIISRSLKFSGVIYEIENVLCINSCGEIESRELIRRTDSVGVVPVFDNGDILFIKEYALGADKEVITIPGGKLEIDDTHEKRALTELLEETGYGTKSLVKLNSFYGDPINYIERKIHIFIAKDIYKRQDDFCEKNSISLCRMSPASFLQSCSANDFFSHPETIASVLLMLYLNKEGFAK